MPAEHNIVELVIRWIWVPIVLAVIRLWARITGFETRSALLEQNQTYNEKQRADDLKHQEDMRESLRSTVTDHHKAIMARMDRLEATIKKNGHS